MAKYTKLVFEKVLGQKYDIPLEILGLEQGSDPKESTCKGGLIATEVFEDNTETLILKDAAGNLSNISDTYTSIGEKEKNEIVQSVEEFFEFMLKDIPSSFNLDRFFGVDNNSIKIAKEECKKDLDTYLERGIELSIVESGNKDNQIEDSLSFYPIKGYLQTLSTKLQEYYDEK